MKIILTLCAALLLFTQSPIMAHATAAPPDEEIVLNPEVMPSFEGGDQIDFLQWVSKRIIYPEKALEQKIEGKVVTSFIIEKNGKFTSPEILASPDTLLSTAVLLALEDSPLWTPGTVDGNPVHTRLTLPFTFELPEEEPVYTEAEIMPLFRGKDNLEKFGKWLGNQHQFDYCTGKLVVQFVVEKDGTVGIVNILISTINYSLAREASEIIKRSEWSPGYVDGKPIRTKFILPLNFGIEPKKPVKPANTYTTEPIRSIKGNEMTTDQFLRTIGR